MPRKSTEAIQPERGRTLEDIKRLLIMALLRSGASQDEIANALGVNQSTISRLFPIKVASAKQSRRGGTKGNTNRGGSAGGRTGKGDAARTRRRRTR